MLLTKLLDIVVPRFILLWRDYRGYGRQWPVFEFGASWATDRRFEHEKTIWRLLQRESVRNYCWKVEPYRLLTSWVHEWSRRITLYNRILTTTILNRRPVNKFPFLPKKDQTKMAKTRIWSLTFSSTVTSRCSARPRPPPSSRHPSSRSP